MITSNPKIRGGEPCVAGTRVPVSALVYRALHQETVETIANDLGLNPDVVRAALRWASERIGDLREKDRRWT